MTRAFVLRQSHALLSLFIADVDAGDVDSARALLRVYASLWASYAVNQRRK